MAIVREPCNVDAHTNNSGLFMTMLCPRLRVHCKKKRKFCKKFPSHIKDQSLGLKGSLDPFNVREESLNGKGINWASLKSKGSFQSRGLYFLREVSRDKNKGNIPGPGNNPLCIRAKSRKVYN